MRITTLFFALFLLPTTSFAVDYNIDNLDYSDVSRQNFTTQVAISVLTDLGFVEGNPDGTFRPNTLLNRAEFTKIAMKLSDSEANISGQCFVDVPLNAWYYEPVCEAKTLGYVRGNEEAGVSPDLWKFVPERNVQYVEALKILYEIQGFDESEISGSYHGQWYDKYVIASLMHGTDLPEGVAVDHKLTRGEMARLVLRFLAYQDGEIDELDLLTEASLSAEVEVSSSSSSISSSSSSIESVSSSSSSESSQSVSSAPAVYDEDEDVSVQRGFLLLGSTSNIMGGAEVFSETQPLIVEEIVVRLMGTAPSVKFFKVFDENKKWLGNAYLAANSAGKEFIVDLPKNLRIEKEEQFSFYVRAVTKAESEGGESGDIVQIERLGVKGFGEWNSKTQSAYSSEDYRAFESARSVITSIDNPNADQDVFISGQEIRLGSFRFTGEKGDGSAKLEITDLKINANTVGTVTVTNVKLGSNGTTDRINCSIASGVISCNAIPASFGSFDDSPRVLTLYGDVASTGSDPALQLRINDPGSPLVAGDVTWTDGEKIFNWVPGDFPVTVSTHFK